MAGTPSPPEPYNVVEAATEGWTDPYTLKPEDEGRTIRFSVDPSVKPVFEDFEGPSWNDYEYDPAHVQRLEGVRTDEDGEAVSELERITKFNEAPYDPYIPGTEPPRGLIEGVGINLRYFRYLLAKQHAGDWLSHHEIELLKSRPDLTIGAIDRQLKAMEEHPSNGDRS